MKQLFIRFMFAVVLITALTTSANALPMPGVIPGAGVNEFIGKINSGGQIGGYYGAQLYLVGGVSDIQVDYYGAEASWKNWFQWGSTQFTHDGGNTITGSVVDTDTKYSVSKGLLHFAFLINKGNNGTEELWNGYNPINNSSTPNFFISFDVENSNAGGAKSGQSVWIFLDDGAGEYTDNHDDMGIKLTVTGGSFSVPEPATLLFLGFGLIGLAGAGRKFKK